MKVYQEMKEALNGERRPLSNDGFGSQFPDDSYRRIEEFVYGTGQGFTVDSIFNKNRTITANCFYV
jgi:hypothetical protein